MTAPTEPGVYDGIPDTVYHADRNSLSSSGARALLPPSSPAKFRYNQDHPVFKDEFDFGHAVHKEVLGVGMKIIEVKADDWRTKAAREAKAAAHSTGKIPLLTKDLEKVHAMATAVREHPTAAQLLSNGKPEQSLYWRDQATGIMRRARPDWMPNPNGSRMILVDYKSANSADKVDFAKSAGDYGYHCQAPWYLDGIRELGLDPNPAFLFVVQEKEAPYLVNVVELAPDALELGSQLNRIAIESYATCMQTGVWPGYGEDIKLVDLPPWIYNRNEELTNVQS